MSRKSDALSALMAKSKADNEVLVCGMAPAAQLSKRLPLLAEPLSVRAAHTPGDLRRELARGRHAVCVIEHEILSSDPTKDIEKLMEMADEIAEDDDAVAALAAKIQFKDSGLTAYDLLPELISSSPETKFVITCHKRYIGATTRLPALYKDCAQVTKVVGSLAEWGNVVYLLKLLSRTYLGKTWTPRRASGK